MSRTSTSALLSRSTGRRPVVWLIALTALVAQVMAACGAASDPPSPPAPTVPRTTVTVPAGVATPSGHQQFSTITSDTGPILQTTLAGASSGVTMRVWVWLPPQYRQPAYAHTAFPALMLYPGGTGAGHNAWVGTGLGGRELVAAGSPAGTVTPFIFVMPEMQVSADRDTECADLPGQPRVGTFLAVDVRRMIEENFRVIRDRAGWGAAGTSSGAYCATRLVFNHPDQYAAVVSMDGYFSIETNLPGAQDPAVRAQDPAAIAASAPPDVSVQLWSGSGRGPDLAGVHRFLALIRPPTRAQLRILPGGRHLTVDLAKMIPGAFAFLTTQLARPVPIPH